MEFGNRIVETYRTGKGKLTIRGKAVIEQVDKKNSKSVIVVTEVG